jgi:hypothetical protein
MKLIRETERLRVFGGHCLISKSTECRGAYMLYVALSHPDGGPVVHTTMPLVTALMLTGRNGKPPHPELGVSLLWLETTKWVGEELGQSLRDEFMEVLREHIPSLDNDPMERDEECEGYSYRDTADVI